MRDIGISSIELDSVLRDFDPCEVKIAPTIIEQSKKIWLVADSSKFGRQALVKMAHLSQIDVLFTNAPPPELTKLRQDSDVELVLAISIFPKK